MIARIAKIVAVSLVASMVLLLDVSTAAAQATAENTDITNIATANWTDVNGNAYTPVSDTVVVTVGFVAGLDTDGSLTATPASPGTDTLRFTIDNIGNGTDSVTVGEVITGTGITVTGYLLDGVPQATLTDLNNALATTAIAGLGDSVVVEVIYTVAAGEGGVAKTYELTATSRRDTNVSDPFTTTITPGLSVAVTVTPDGTAIQRLTSNGVATYTETYTVTNNSNGPETFDLIALATPALIQIDSVHLAAGDSTQITLGPGAFLDIDVVYQVLGAPGSTDDLFLRARSVATPAVSDTGFYSIDITGPSLVVTKEAYLDDGLTLLTSTDRVLPGDTIRFKVTITNAGDFAADTVEVDDTLPPEVTFDSTIPDGAGWTFTTGALPLVEADLTGLLPPASGAPANTRFFWIRVAVK